MVRQSGGFFVQDSYMKEQEIDPNKYIIHKSGVPIRIPPYLRKDIAAGHPDSAIQIKMIGKDPHIGKRNLDDTLPMNLGENIRLRRIVKKTLAPQLVAYAEDWKIQRYVILVHGSLAKGLVRNPSSQDVSDIDIDLIIDDEKISKEARMEVRERMRSSSHEAKVDSYAWNMDELRRNTGMNSRHYMRSASYPVVDKGDLWREILWTGIESQRFLNLPKNARSKLRTILALIANGQRDQTLEFIHTKDATTEITYNYLYTQGLLDSDIDSATHKAIKLCSLVSVGQSSKKYQKPAGTNFDRQDHLTETTSPGWRNRDSIYFA